MSDKILTESEVEKLMLSVFTAAGEGGLTEEEAKRQTAAVVDWAENARIDATLLQLVLDGSLVTSVLPGETEVRFTAR